MRLVWIKHYHAEGKKLDAKYKERREKLEILRSKYADKKGESHSTVMALEKKNQDYAVVVAELAEGAPKKYDFNEINKKVLEMEKMNADMTILRGQLMEKDELNRELKHKLDEVTDEATSSQAKNRKLQEERDLIKIERDKLEVERDKLEDATSTANWRMLLKSTKHTIRNTNKVDSS